MITRKLSRSRVSRRAYGLVAQAYTSISAEDFASFVGYSVEEAVKDPPPVSLVPNEQQLARLTDYVAFLEN
ncbi:COP9 signalosome complex subunit 8 [Silurus meridionalis]|nr:COP9 signalosome complex subunit 8 [Silurus meridionalis]